jgi:hypothetical protein
MANWASVLSPPDFHQRYADASAQVRGKTEQYQTEPAQYRGPSGLEAGIEGAIGGAVAGLEVAGIAGALPAKPASPGTGGSPGDFDVSAASQNNWNFFRSR